MEIYRQIKIEPVAYHSLQNIGGITNLEELFLYINKNLVDDYDIQVLESVFNSPELIISIKYDYNYTQFRTVDYINDGSDRYINNKQCINNLLAMFNKNKRTAKINKLLYI